NRTEPSDELIFRSPLTCWALIEVPVPTIASDAALITSMVEAPDLIVELSIRFVALILEDDASSLTGPLTSRRSRAPLPPLRSRAPPILAIFAFLTLSADRLPPTLDASRLLEPSRETSTLPAIWATETGPPIAFIVSGPSARLSETEPLLFDTAIASP